jgi:hypothetical protein
MCAGCDERRCGVSGKQKREKDANAKVLKR